MPWGGGVACVRVCVLYVRCVYVCVLCQGCLNQRFGGGDRPQGVTSTGQGAVGLPTTPLGAASPIGQPG